MAFCILNVDGFKEQKQKSSVENNTKHVPPNFWEYFGAENVLRQVWMSVFEGVCCSISIERVAATTSKVASTTNTSWANSK